VTMVNNPPRLVVDLENVKPERGLREKKFSRMNVEKMRVGRHQSFTRLVFDLSKNAPYSEFSSGIEDGRIVISLSPKTEKEIKIEPVSNSFAGESVNKPEKVSKDVVTNPEVKKAETRESVSEVKEKMNSEKPVVKSELIKREEKSVKSEDNPAGQEEKRIILSDISVKQYNGYSRLTISFDSENIEHSILKETDKEIQLRFSKCRISDDVPSVINKVEKSGPVTMIQISKEKEKKTDGSCIISVIMREKVPHHLVRENRNINWDFYYSEKPQQVKFSEEMVAGDEKGGDMQEKSDDSDSKKTYKGKRISMDFKDANIHNILRLISDVAKINIITSDDVKGNVTVTLRNVPWDQALEIILKTKGLGMKKTGNIIRVAPLEVFQKEAEAEMAKKKALDALEPLKVRLIPVNYGYAKDIVSQVKDVLSDRGTINIDDRTNVIIIKDKLENIIKAEGLIRSLDTQTPQVLIEARIVEANTSFIRDIGIQWGGNMVFAPQYGNPTGLAFPNVVGINGGADDARTINQLSGVQNPAGFAVNMPAPVGAGAGGAIGFILGSASGSANLNLRLSALENTGHVKILSAPRVTTLDNKEAKISSGVSIPISQVSAAGVMTVFIDAKLELAVTPHVTQDGSIMLKIVTTKNEPDFSRTGAQGDPTILKKEAFTQVLVKDGDTTVIGGIYTRRQAEEYAKVPLLSNIPVLGWLFKKKKSSDERTELLIFITPRIVNRAEAIMQQKG
ncbi:MAG: type IV pilus secretin PilQ, partial [Deltaproteobacteria bacterium]|nr:type IV pilus secretin PilQ [Deltaproteobacteria bacterium]